MYIIKSIEGVSMKTQIKKIYLTTIKMILNRYRTINKEIFLNAPIKVNRYKLVAMINKTRHSGCFCGDQWFPPVKKITWCSLAEQAAQLHSNDMNQNDFFRHEGSDNSSAGDRLHRVGYTWHTYGENIAKGFPTEQDVIEGWLKSPRHCKNIMDKDFTRMGIATKSSYWTQIFT